MSDYITELRRELVDAAERQQRRSVPRRAVRRSRWPIMTGLAGVAAAAALVLGVVLGARELSNPAPAGPRVVATVRFGGIPTGAALGAGSVWVTGHDGSLWRIDPERRRVVATIDVGTEATQVAASGDAVWVVADEQNRRHRLCGSTRPVVSSRRSPTAASSGAAARSWPPGPAPSGCRPTRRRPDP